MLFPNPVLNEEEKDLVTSAPEACFRRAVGRGALSLDQATADLPPHVAAAVRSVATGERPGPEDGPPSGLLDRSPSPDPAPDDRQAEYVRHWLADFPHLAELFEAQALTPDDALEAAQAIDLALGRYLTGTRYAAP